MKAVFVWLSILGVSVSLRTSLKVESLATSRLALPFSLEIASPIPVPKDDVIERYCHVDPETTPRLRTNHISLMEYGGPEEDDPTSREAVLYGQCDSDSDCKAGRPFCIDSICRECREGYEVEDCGHTGAICNESTGYTCSSCADDKDCPSMKFCRSVFDRSALLSKGALPRKKCVACPSTPLFGEVHDERSCSWSCPIEQYFMAGGGDEPAACLDCPQCRAGQFYAPRANPSTQFVSTCTNATDVICQDCKAIGIDAGNKNFCAEILSPAIRHADEITVGDLGPTAPCRFFKCKADWYLDRPRNKCKKCHFEECQPGDYLKNCGGAEPGKCVACKGRIPNGAIWIIANDPSTPLHSNLDACQYVCPHTWTLDSDKNECVPCTGDMKFQGRIQGIWYLSLIAKKNQNPTSMKLLLRKLIV